MTIEYDQKGHKGVTIKAHVEPKPWGEEEFYLTWTTHNYELDVLELGFSPARDLRSYDWEGWFIWAPDWAYAFGVCDWCFQKECNDECFIGGPEVLHKF